MQRPAGSSRLPPKLVGGADTGLSIVDANGEFELLGARFAELLGARPGVDGDAMQSAIEASWSDLYARLEGAREKVLEQGSATEDVEIETARGSKRLRCKLFQLTGRGLLIQLRDRHALEALVKDLRMAAYHRNLTALYMAKAHDLKGPLNAMALQLELLRRKISADSQSESLEIAAAIGEEVERLKALIEDTLSETAPSVEQLEEIDLADVSKKVMHQIRSQARTQGISIDCDFDPRATRALVYEQQLRHVVLNLAINSCEAMTTGGHLCFRTRARDSQVVLEIEDTGPGIPEEVRDDLFELHVTSKENGTGIGLWSARTTIEALGGTVELVDTESQGTTFAIKLPAVPPARVGDQEEQAP